MRDPDTRADPVIKDAIDRGYLDSGEVYDIPSLPTHGAAVEGMKSLYRSARRQNLALAAWIADEAGDQCGRDCQADNTQHRVRFRLFSKNNARTHVFRQSRGDPANLKYNPWDRARTQRYTDDGRAVS